MASAPQLSRLARSDSIETLNADACYRKVKSILKNPTEASIATAEKVYEYANEQGFFTPSGCSIYSGSSVEQLGELCKEAIATARENLDKPVEERKLMRRMSWLE